MIGKLVMTMLLVCGGVVNLFAKTNFMESDFFESVEQGDKAALVMVHFGTSHADTRAKTIDALNDLAVQRYPQLEVREAWTSRMIIRILDKRGERVLTPLEQLQQLKKEGYTHVIIQSSNIIDGVEMESLRRDVMQMQGEFEELRVGNPLLYTPEDYERVVEILKTKQPDGKALVLVGHGTYTPATAQYAMVDYVLRDKGYCGVHIGTIEGYPTYDTMLKNLNAGETKEVVLMPFMFVAGEHAKNDIAEDWSEQLTQAGYEVEPLLEGLGEDSAIQQIFMDHIEFVLANKMYDIIEKKAGYLEGKVYH